MAKSTDFVFDRGANRWRRGGKWSSPPKRSQLRSDSRGAPIDATGKRVPLGAFKAKPAKPKAAPKPTKPKTRAKPVAAPKAKPKVKPKAKPKTRPKAKAPTAKPKRAAKPRKKRLKAVPTVRRPKLRPSVVTMIPGPLLEPIPAPVEPSEPIPAPFLKGERRRAVPFPSQRGTIQYLAPYDNITDRALMSSSGDNYGPPYQAYAVLENTLEAKANLRQIDPNDVTAYRHGIEFVNTYGRVPIEQTEQLVRFLSTKYPELSFKYADTSVHVFMGERDTPVMPYAAVYSMKQNTDALLDIYEEFAELWDGDIGWYVFLENDEIESGS